MNGIEKITGRIEADTQAEIDRDLSAAQAQAEALAADYRAQAGREEAELRAKYEKAAAEREERLVSVAQMECRKAILAAKQQQVEAAFDQALEALCAMPEERYIAVASALLAKAAPNGKGQVVFSQADRQRVGQAVVDKANQALGGALELSDQTRPLRGGFILVNGNVEVNCTFDTLVRLQKGAMAGEAAKCLFPEA